MLSLHAFLQNKVFFIINWEDVLLISLTPSNKQLVECKVSNHLYVSLEKTNRVAFVQLKCLVGNKALVKPNKS